METLRYGLLGEYPANISQVAMTARNILILMSNTGGGHRASALALQAGFHLCFPGRFQVEIIDLLVDYTFWPLNRSPQIYSTIATRVPSLWGLAYATEGIPEVAHGAMRLAARLSRRHVLDALQRSAPDIVVSVHPLAQELTLGAMANRPGRLPFFTVVTDLATVHPLWLNQDVDGCYVATEDARKAATRAGLREEQIHVLGLPVRPAFEESYPSARELKRRLGLDVDLPLALLMGGGDGVGPVEEIAEAIARSLSLRGRAQGQLAVVCGRNEALRSRLAQRAWEIPVHVLGFVDAMPEWMCAAQCLITKAGPGTIAEAMICGLPMILSGYIPGQEVGNVSYVTESGAGLFDPEPATIGWKVMEWFGTRAEERTRMAANARALGRPHATREIATSIVGSVDQWG